MKIYVASSWRNPLQPTVVDVLRQAGHEVYDFRNPPNGTGFAWSEIDPDWQAWRAVDYREMLMHPRAEEGYASDFDAMKWADCCVLVLPCGRSAHLELGWSVGAGKRTIILTRDGEEPELMAKMADAICVSLEEVRSTLDWFTAEAASKPLPAPSADLMAFLRRRVVRAAEGRVLGSELFASYVQWARDNGWRPLSVRAFIETMGDLRFETVRDGSRTYFSNLQMLPHEESRQRDGDTRIIREKGADPVSAAVSGLSDEQKERLLA